MEDFNSVVFGKEPQINPLKAEEKKKVRKTSNLIGAAFIAMSLVPTLLNSLVSDIVRIIGPTADVIAFVNDPAFILVLQILFSIIIFTLPFLILPVGLGKKTAELGTFKKPQGGLFIPFVFIGVGISAFGNIASNQIGSIFEMIGVYFDGPDFKYPAGIFGMILSYLSMIPPIIIVNITPVIKEIISFTAENIPLL